MPGGLPRGDRHARLSGYPPGVTYILAAVIVAAMAATPVPLPPSWLALAYLSVELGAHPVGMVVAGALGAAAGRTLMVWAARRAGPRLMGPATRANVDYLAGRLHGRRGTWGAAALLALSPPPATALYIAAGLVRINLAVVAAACFAGRLVTYGIAVAVVGAAAAEIADRLRASVGPWSVTLGVLVVAASLWLLTRIDWRLLLERRRLRVRVRPRPSRVGAGA